MCHHVWWTFTSLCFVIVALSTSWNNCSLPSLQCWNLEAFLSVDSAQCSECRNDFWSMCRCWFQTLLRNLERPCTAISCSDVFSGSGGSRRICIDLFVCLCHAVVLMISFAVLIGHCLVIILHYQYLHYVCQLHITLFLWRQYYPFRVDCLLFRW